VLVIGPKKTNFFECRLSDVLSAFGQQVLHVGSARSCPRCVSGLTLLRYHIFQL